MFPSAAWRIKGMPGEKVVYLTFDDGPSPGYTRYILDLLDNYGFKATFFVVGDNVVRYPALLDEIRRRGHAVGNHTMHHSQGLKRRSSEFIEEVENENALLGTSLFRPPHGFLRRSQYKFLKRHYRIVMFDVVTKDYDRSLSPHKVLANVKRYTRNGSIIVFHDSEKAGPNLVKALPEALEWLKQQGYESRSIPMD